MRLDNKTVVITGASSGIGKACAYRCAAEGANLILIARRSSRLEILARELIEKYSTNIVYFECDVRYNDRVENVFSTLSEK